MIKIDKEKSEFSISIGECNMNDVRLKIVNYGCLESKGLGDISTISYLDEEKQWINTILDCGSTLDRDKVTEINKSDIDQVILSHWHTDHVMGIIDIRAKLAKNKIPIYFGYNEKIVSLKSSANADDLIRSLRTTDYSQLRFDKKLIQDLYFIKDRNVLLDKYDIKIELWPPNLNEHKKDAVSAIAENQLSLCTSVSLKNFRYLSMGDITPATCASGLFENGCYSIIKLPHHGSYINNCQGKLADHFNGKEATYIISGVGGSEFTKTIIQIMKNASNNVVLVSDISSRAKEAATTIGKCYTHYPNNFVLCEELTTSVDSNGNVSATGVAKVIEEGKLVNKRYQL